MSTNIPAPGVPPKKKTSPIVWILVGVVAFFFLIGVLVLGAGYYFVRQAKSNPSLFVAKMITAANPNVEVVSYDEAKGIIVVKDKQTGKRFTMNFQDVKNGRLVMQEEGKEAVSMEATGSGLEVKSAEGTVKIGAGGKLPDWIPAYPGVSPEGTFSMQGEEGQSGSFHFNTKDAADKVLSFYAEGLKKAGMKTTSTVTTDSGGLVGAESDDKKRTVTVTVGKDEQGTSVAVMFSSKK